MRGDMMPTINIENDMDMHRFEILNQVAQRLTSDPTSPVEALWYYSTVDKRIHFYTGTEWVVYSTAGDLNSALSGKVDKVEGKQLSTEDFTTALKSKLDGIASGAEVNVQSDWNAVDGDALILNKPTLGSAAALDTGTAAGNIPVLTGQGKLPDSVIPPLAIGELAGSVQTKADLVTLSNAQQGDIARVTAETEAADNGVYFLNGTYSDLSSWIQIVGPGAVLSVNGQSGVVLITASDVGAVPTTRTVNGHPLSSDVVLTPSDVGAVEANSPISAGSGSVVTYDEKGLVLSARPLEASDVPSLDASKIATGTLAVGRIPTGNGQNLVPLLGGQAQNGQVLTWSQEQFAFVPQTPSTGDVNSFSGTMTGNGSQTEWSFQHGLGKRGVAQVVDSNGDTIWVCSRVTATAVTVTFGRAPALGDNYVVTVVG